MRQPEPPPSPRVLSVVRITSACTAGIIGTGTRQGICPWFPLTKHETLPTHLPKYEQKYLPVFPPNPGPLYFLYPALSFSDLKGQCQESFCFRFFFHESSSPQAPENNSRVIFFFEFVQKSVEIFASEGAAPVSLTPAANFAAGTVGVVDTGGWQIMETLSDCWNLRVNVKKKMYLQYMLTRLLKGVLKKLAIFWLKIFLFATGVNPTCGAPWAANISANFRNGILRGLGDTDSWKKLVTLSL